jgi:Flp pilus assembly protein TadD
VLSINWPEAEREFSRAIELNPNSALARSRYAFLLMICGRREEAVADHTT